MTYQADQPRLSTREHEVDVASLEFGRREHPTE